MTPDDYLRRARELDAEAERIARAGDIKGSVALAIEAEHLRRAATELRKGLSSGNRAVMVTPVTSTETVRRGESVARTSAKKSGHPVRLAIAASKWKTVSAYAEKRLRRTQAALSRYILGTLDCPPEVADQVRTDFGLGDDVWPRPPRR